MAVLPRRIGYEELVRGDQVRVRFRDGAYGTAKHEPFPATFEGFDFVEDEETGEPLPEELFFVFTDPEEGPRLYPADYLAGTPLTAPHYDLAWIEGPAGRYVPGKGE